MIELRAEAPKILEDINSMDVGYYMPKSVHACLFLHVYIYIYVCVYICLHSCIYIRLSDVCVCLPVNICTYTNSIYQLFIFVNVRMYVLYVIC